MEDIFVGLIVGIGWRFIEISKLWGDQEINRICNNNRINWKIVLKLQMMTFLAPTI